MKLFRQVLGEGVSAVALTHGLFGWGNNLMPIARGLAESGYRCILPDLRNHGRSPHAMQMSYSLMAEDIRELLDELGIDRIHFVGHSMGGKAAMQFALHYPDRVASLCVADIAPVAYPAHHDAVIEALDKIQHTRPARRRDVHRLLTEACGDEGVAAFLATNWTRQQDGEFAWRFNLPALRTHYAEIMAAPRGAPFTGKVLFLKGELSNYITNEHREAMLSLFPRSRMKVIAGAGHWLHAEKPTVFTRLVKDFLCRGQSKILRG